MDNKDYIRGPLIFLLYHYYRVGGPPKFYAWASCFALSHASLATTGELCGTKSFFKVTPEIPDAVPTNIAQISSSHPLSLQRLQYSGSLILSLLPDLRVLVYRHFPGILY